MVEIILTHTDVPLSHGMDSNKVNSRPNPRERANFLSVLFWWWTVKIFKEGYNKVLTVEDLYDSLKKDQSSFLGDRLEKQWDTEVQKAQKFNRQPSLLKTLFYTFRKELILTGLFHAIAEFIVKLSSPIFLGWVLQYFEPNTSLSYKQAISYAVGLAISTFLTVLLTYHLLYQSHHLGCRMRIAICSLVYRKTLKLSNTALGEEAPGKIVNLVANDVNRFDLVLTQLHQMWSCPLLTIIVAYILFTKVRFAALVGIAVFGSVVPIQIYNGKLWSKYRHQTALKTDERIRLMDEIISGVQVIKMYAWEKPFCALVELSRKLELKVVKKSSYLRGLYMTFFLFTARMALYCTLMAIILLKQPLATDTVFVITSFYNILTNALVFSFVRGFAEIAECRVSIQRLQSFLMLDEFKVGNVTITEQKIFMINPVTEEMDMNGAKKDSIVETTTPSSPSINEIRNKKYFVSIENVTAKWILASTDNVLENINLQLEKGKLYAVIGMVGSGKSSLLSSILGEINLVKGGIKIEGKISYANQDSWIFGATVRQNILFGQKFDKQRYHQVIKACSLLKDFTQFSMGDQTIVGERGCSLSGGQKARINLARCVYRQADIYLLDDPLSAVDAHVGKHLFKKCITKYLKDTTRLLATHQLQYIKYVDGIILLNQGKMQYYQDHHTLLEDYPEYNSLIAVKQKENTNDLPLDKPGLLRKISSRIERQSINSESSDLELNENADESNNAGENIEKTSKGAVKGSVFFKYFQAGSGFCIIITMAMMFLLTQVLVCFNDILMPYVVTREESLDSNNTSNDTLISTNNTLVLRETNARTTEYYIYVYTAVVLSIFIVGVTRAFIFYDVCLRSNERLHNRAFGALIRTNMHFFDTNPSGRILNRFSKDITGFDELLPRAMLDAAQILLSVAGALVITCIVNIIFLAPIVILGIISHLIRKVYLKSSKNMKRLEGMTRSPVFTHLNATLQGISTIRAYQTQQMLKDEFDKFQDVHTSALYMFIACSNAYGFALDMFSFCIMQIITFSFFIFKEQFTGREVGLAITQIMSIATFVQWGMRQSAEVANQLMSVERVLEYTQIPPEKNLRDKGITYKKKRKRTNSVALFEPGKEWPKDGTVQFKNVYMRYCEEDEPVLEDLNFYIKPAEKIGIVGRTGAGKSSLIAALFRLAPLEGTIEIDQVDTGTISLEDLRSRISIIPQDPVLFSGTLRRNLDPFGEYPDESIWQTLEEVELKDAILAIGNGLDSRVLERGTNFSVGQRQLVCLARAVLRNHKVLMMDEATANVDPQTDVLIQRTIRTKFASCTVLTVAHRLNTIIDSDKVIVMDKGHLVEFDHPFILLQKQNSQFHSLVKETGDAMFEKLFELAKKSYNESCV